MAEPSTPTLPQIGEETARELLACPFCGSTEVSVSFSAKLDNPDPSARFIECEDCGAMGPPCDIADHGSDDAAKLAAAACWSSRAALGPPPTEVPIPMILHCPKCGLQHIDEPAEPEFDDEGRAIHWSNPPHRSHLCHGCGTIWRPADVPTNGVARIETVGKADTWGRFIGASPAPPCCLGVVEALERMTGNARLGTAMRSKWVQVPAADYHAGVAALQSHRGDER